jgi:sugar phosphate isomerase/epimerase
MMKPLENYARLGMVHHLLYSKSLNTPEDHARTLREFVKRTDIETFDCCLPYGEPLRSETAKAVAASGKEHLVFATHLFPLRKLSFASTSYSEQAQARMIVADMVAQAASIGATGFIFASGGPTPSKATEANYTAFADFCLWLCDQLRPHGITAMLEPFDMEFDKCFLMGATRRCVQLLEDLKVDNIGLELDMAHLPLMKEPFHEAIETCAPWLKRVHLGNCVMRHPQDPFYGDNHPPIGYPNGEIDVPQLVPILQDLLNVGFLNTETRGDLVIEFNPFPGRSENESALDNIERVRQAWSQVC